MSHLLSFPEPQLPLLLNETGGFDICAFERKLILCHESQVRSLSAQIPRDSAGISLQLLGGAAPVYEVGFSHHLLGVPISQAPGQAVTCVTSLILRTRLHERHLLHLSYRGTAFALYLPLGPGASLHPIATTPGGQSHFTSEKAEVQKALSVALSSASPQSSQLPPTESRFCQTPATA